MSIWFLLRAHLLNLLKLMMMVALTYFTGKQRQVVQ